MKKPNNHISIVISTRNAVQYIDRCLQSAISQDYDDYEIIFLDAQSTDGTYEKALEYSDKFKNINLIINYKL
jgi:glycosyltransferase involved in cell wall biosynthesis